VRIARPVLVLVTNSVLKGKLSAASPLDVAGGDCGSADGVDSCLNSAGRQAVNVYTLLLVCGVAAY